MKSNLRSGYTTGACAAAAAKGAAELLLSGNKAAQVEISLPEGLRISFSLAWSRRYENYTEACIRKDGGDDPDITNGALIIAQVSHIEGKKIGDPYRIDIIGGDGVGTVTKPGLAVAVGQPAINPVPMKMIEQSVTEVLKEHDQRQGRGLQIKIIVPDGLELAKKTLNKRLGIIGGISILGTTGIVRPVSADAWTATISASMDVATAAGIKEIVLSTGRTSERCIENVLNPPEESLVMMGDYLDFSLQEVKKHDFTRVHMAAMWAKLLKGAMKKPHTHVRHGALELDDVFSFMLSHGTKDIIVDKLRDSNTARETLDRLIKMQSMQTIDLVCRLAQEHYEETAGIPVSIYLVNGAGDLLRLRE